VTPTSPSSYRRVVPDEAQTSDSSELWVMNPS
jgi:hypothetical protein